MTIDDLLMQHKGNAEVILFKYVSAFKQLNKDSAEEYFEGLGKIITGFQSDMASSGTDVFHNAIMNGVGANEELVKGVLLINAEYGTNFSKAINGEV